MPSNAITGIGVEFRRWNTATVVWEKIAEITDISGPDMKRATIDVTSMNSINGYKEFIAGLREAGSIKLSMNFTRDSYDLMKGDFESDVKQNYEMVFPDKDNTSFEFEGLVTEMPLKVPTTKQIEMNVSIQISDQVTINSGSGPSPA